MNEEDEAFEYLAKRQGDWGMQGSRKHQIMRYAENIQNKGASMTDKEAMKLALDALETLMIERGSIYEKAIAALKERLAQPEPIQSLQCFHCQVTIETLNDKVMQLMAQRTWVGLTDDDKQIAFDDTQEGGGFWEFADAIEAKLKEKNT